MLIQRIITAVALLAILLPALFAATAMPFVVCAWVLLSLGAWEWARLNGVGFGGSVGYGLVCAVMCVGAYGLSWSQGFGGVWATVWLIAGAAWVLGGAWCLAKGVIGWGALPRSMRLLVGLAVLFLAWLAVAQARQIGANFLLSALALVWVADIGAYAGGRMLSRYWPPKLAPAISPGKTWMGAISGAMCSLLLAGIWIWAERMHGGVAWGAASLPTRLYTAGPLMLLIGVVFVVAMAIVGDLFESLMKRAAGAKDSSRLLPGHGGVLDRVDALLPAVPLALMLAALLERLA